MESSIFYTFTAAPLFTSAEPKPVKAPKYKAGDTIYLECAGNKYIIIVESYDEDRNVINAASYKSLEGLGPVKVGDTVYLTLGKTMFIANVNKIHERGFYGDYISNGDGDNWTERCYFGLFLVSDNYKRHNSLREMKESAKNA